MSSFSTESQTIAIGVARASIEAALIALFDKLKELESLAPSEETSAKIDITKIRLDTLAKVEKHLLAALQDTYSDLGKNPTSFGPGTLFAATDTRDGLLIASLMQGL